ncbi:MAG: hypothetical protein MZV65_46490 [Chromatiales bacterium]|nr:hypothetical protein [Chromatiales bacterium]
MLPSEKVGLAGDGGELVIGSMNKNSDNEWGAKNTTVDGTTSGIEEFYVTVYGDASKSSSLAGLHSTNNNLRVVTVDTDAAVTGANGYADLTIGNSNTRGLRDIPSLRNANALKDVQVFDASGFKGDLTVFAALTDEITPKYFDLRDQAPNDPAADNIAFEYTGGTGNDYFNIALDASNAAFAGTATREDFSLEIDGGAGDDTIVVALRDGRSLAEDDTFGLTYRVDGELEGAEFSKNWYDNVVLLEGNIRINGGEGNDTIWTPGAGNMIINGGAGNDAIYADNTGDKAIWAFNVAEGFPWARERLNDLQSDANNTYQLFNAKLVVSYLGFEVEVSLPHTQGVVTDLQINRGDQVGHQQRREAEQADRSAGRPGQYSGGVVPDRWRA